MESIREAVIKCLDKYSNEDELISDLNRIIEREGDKAYQTVFHVLTHLELQPDEAKECWSQIIKHRSGMSKLMGRSVNLRTVICDYFCTVSQSLKNPKVVEIHVFEKTVRDSRYDSLTGLFNRRSFDEELTRELSRAKRYNTDLSILFLDLDDFKKVNDTFGHLAGDEVLRRVAGIVLQSKRAEDIAARYGGEELVLILPATSKENAMIVGERIRTRVEEMALEYGGKTIQLTISGGVASFPVNANEAAELVQCSDSALYRSKSSGKNMISQFSPDKRRYVRFEFNQEIMVRELGFDDTVTRTAQSKNICIGGILFENTYPLEIGKNVQLNIPVGENAILFVLGTVVRVEQIDGEKYATGVSISLLEMDKAIKKELSNWLKIKTIEKNGGIEV